MLKKKLGDLILLGLVIFNFAALTPVHAQSADQLKNGFSISPPSFDIKASPGDQLTNSIKIENITGKTIDLSAKVENFVAYGNEGQIQLTEEDSAFSINSWIIFEQQEFSVEPGEIKVFNFVVNVPKDAQPGSHFGSIVFTTSATSTNPNSAKVVQEIGSVLLIKLPGEVVESAKLTQFKSDSNYFTEPKIKLDALVDNIGSVVVKPAGTITVSDIFGNTVQKIDVAGKNILPGSQRVFDQEFDFDKVGYFKTKIELNYGTGQKLTAETSFISLYTQRLIPAIIIILVLLILYWLLRKRINRAISIIVKG